MLTRIKELIKLQEDFSFETTLSARYFVTLIKEAQQQGYFVTLIFFWLNSLELAIQRVKMRVSEGGHNIPEETIKKRYNMGITNLIEMYIPVCDYWMVVNNSFSSLQIIAEGIHNNGIEIKEEVIWDKINQQAHE